MPAISSLGNLRGRAHGRASRDRRRTGQEKQTSACVVDCGVYINGVRQPGEWSHAEAIAEVRKRGEGFVWIGLHEPDEKQIQGIAETFGLHELAVEDAVHAHQRPKLERYDDTLFMVFRTIRYVEHDSPTTANEIVESGELMGVPRLRFHHHRAARQPRRTDASTQGARRRPRTPPPRTGGGVARHRRLRGRPLPRRHRTHRGRHRRDGDRGLRASHARSPRNRSTCSSVR